MYMYVPEFSFMDVPMGKSLNRSNNAICVKVQCTPSKYLQNKKITPGEAQLFPVQRKNMARQEAYFSILKNRREA